MGKYPDSRRHWIVWLMARKSDPLFPKSKKHRTAALCLGIGVNKAGDGPNGRTAAVVDRAVAMYQHGDVDHIFLVGHGGGNPTIPEYEAMMRYIKGRVPDDAVSCETQSTTTKDNAGYMYPILRLENFTRAYIIAEAQHAGRAGAIFWMMYEAAKFPAELKNIPVSVQVTYGEYNDSQGTHTTPAAFAWFNFQAFAHHLIHGLIPRNPFTLWMVTHPRPMISS
jgi:uncharacterized SAM-binding protein YcdF (DUF218 family)